MGVGERLVGIPLGVPWPCLWNKSFSSESALNGHSEQAIRSSPSRPTDEVDVSESDRMLDGEEVVAEDQENVFWDSESLP